MKNKFIIFSLALFLVFSNFIYVNAQTKYQVGETILIPNALEYTLNKVYLTEARNPASSQKPREVIVIDYTIKNVSGDDIFLFSNFYHNVYNNGKLKLPEYPLESKFQGTGTLKNGEMATIKRYYSVDEPIKFIEVDVLSLNFKNVVGYYTIKENELERE